jgi:dihydrofolate synthase/folylpolyglutamate synthase
VDYQEAEGYVFGLTDYERLPRLSSGFELGRVEKLLSSLGNPHLSSRTIHIAGTKGKGSVAAMIEAGLRDAGYRVGLYTSPHLSTSRERIRVDEKPIREEEFACLVERIKLEAEKIEGLTTFEVLTAVAFTYFQEKEVEFQVMEVGLGGRLDATNVVHPEICLITSISLDHTEVLGSTLASVAYEKAGIIKPGVPVISAPQRREAEEVIQHTCWQKGAPLIKSEEEISLKYESHNLREQKASVFMDGSSRQLTLPLLGEHQLENAALAILALKDIGVPPWGISKVIWPGRLQVAREEPLIILDGAHNPDSCLKLRMTLDKYFAFDEPIFILGISQDKDALGILDALLPGSFIFTSPPHPRAVLPQSLALYAKAKGVSFHTASDLASALDLALSQAALHSLICVTGSLFLISPALLHLGVPLPDSFQ